MRRGSVHPLPKEKGCTCSTKECDGLKYETLERGAYFCALCFINQATNRGACEHDPKIKSCICQMLPHFGRSKREEAHCPVRKGGGCACSSRARDGYECNVSAPTDCSESRTKVLYEFLS
jgi:hypothetical protein